MGYLIAILLGYLLGCSSMALYLSKLKHVDVRKKGSGNLGASNVTIFLGWKAGVLVALHDILKATLAVWLARWLFPDLELIGSVAGVSCVMGHIFPFYLHFKGGKGFASYFGVALALDWKFAMILAVILILITLVTDYIVCSTITATLAIPAYFTFMTGSFLVLLILLVPTVVMIWLHRDNYRRIRNGTEIGLRAARSGKHRVS